MLIPLGSIPSPSSSTIFEGGPIVLRWYGTLIAIGVLVAIRLTRREFVRRGLDQETVFSIATWAIPGGIIGARIYHVITDWSRFSGDLGEIPAIWHGGLGLPGVVMGGALATAIGARRNGIRPLVAFDCIAPGSSSHRRSAGGATTSTRSSSAVRRRCPGVSRSRPSIVPSHTGRPRRSIRPFSTRASGTWASSCWS